MNVRIPLTVAAMSVMIGSTALAEPLTTNGPDVVNTPPQDLTAATGQPQPLMGLLDQAGIGRPLENAGIQLFGHLEGSYTYNFEPPAGDLNAGRVFDLRDNRPTVNQLDFNIERQVDLTKHQWDVGGRVELLYGSDSDFLHSNGLLDYQDYFSGTEYQFDLPQAYIDIGIPLGEGVRVRLGKFLFFKQIDPNQSVFYSHSFSFGAALPFTLTGVTGYYPVNDSLSVEAGISRGWDQSIKDNNGAIDGLFRVREQIGRQLSLSLAGIVGPELDNDNSHYRETLDFTAGWTPNDQWTFLLDAVIGTQAQPSAVGDANWYGVSVYAIHPFNEFVSAGARLEWYRDEEGFTTAVPQTLYEATIGLTITPLADTSCGTNLKIRPELRGDYSTARFFDGLTRHAQFTAAVDAIVDF